MNIHKRGIALSGRFCRLEHPSNTHTHITHGRRQVPQVRIWNQTPPTEEDKYLKYESETKHHPRKKTSTSSTNLKPNTTHGRRQVPQVQIWNQTPPKEEDKYLKYESETKYHPRNKTSTSSTNRKPKHQEGRRRLRNTGNMQWRLKAYQLRLRNSRHPRREFINLQTSKRRP